MKYKARFLEDRLQDALRTLPVVFVNGPRRAGKSTLTRHVAQKHFDADYVTFDDISVFSAASRDPQGFLRQFKKPVVIDEVQMVPSIFRPLKKLVDEYREKEGRGAHGRFLLTGSTNIMTLPDLSDALTGRMAVLSLYPLSAVETMGQGLPVINGWFDQEIAFHADSRTENEKHSFGEMMRQTTFPEIRIASEAERSLWLDSYLTTLLQRDVRQLADIEKMAVLPHIVQVLASRAGGLLNDADCARDCGLNPMTYRRYRTLLQHVFLIHLLPPWHNNRGKRAVKSPKLFFTDTSLLCRRLGVEVESLQRQNPSLFGHVLENFVAAELLKQITVLPDCSLHHFRTHEGEEVDFVIERRDGTVLGVEVKTKDAVNRRDFAGLNALKEQAGKSFHRGIVLYMGKDILSFGDDMVAMPLDSLWRFDMDVRRVEEINHSSSRMACILWAQYGESTRVRCMISDELISDIFAKRATGQNAIEMIQKHLDVIWPAFERRIRNGRLERDAEDGALQTILSLDDFGRQNFRYRDA